MMGRLALSHTLCIQILSFPDKWSASLVLCWSDPFVAFVSSSQTSSVASSVSAIRVTVCSSILTVA